MSKPFCKEHFERYSTEGDSSSDPDEDLCQPFSQIKTNPLKHKTELCKKYSELGYCNYGQKCRFAHGRHELIPTLGHQKQHKDRKCKGFWKNGICPYGTRCQFGHMAKNWTSNSILTAEQAILMKESTTSGSKLLKLL